MFTFSRAKLAYYGGSTLMWLDQPADHRRAAASAESAIEQWEAGDPADRSLDDEALAHVYAATAHVKLADLDAATTALAPVLALPAERRISWLRNRIDEIGELLTAPAFAGSASVAELRADVDSFA